MTNTIRKRLGPLSVVATIAVIGALAAFIALAALPDGASAQTPPPPPAPPGQDGGGGPPAPPEPPGTPEPTPEPNESPVGSAGVLSDEELHISTTSDPIDVADAFSDPDGDSLTYRAASNEVGVANATIVGSVMTIVAGPTRGTATITVTADDGKGGTASVSFMVTVVEVYTLTSEPEWDDEKLREQLASLRPDLSQEQRAELLDRLSDRLDQLAMRSVFDDLGRPQFYVVLRNDFDPAVDFVAKFNLAVAGSEDDVTVTVTTGPNPDKDGDGVRDDPEENISITDSDGLIGAGFVDEAEGDLEGSLTVKATDAGSRAFEIEGMCRADGAFAVVDVDDKDLNLVAQGTIVCLVVGEPQPDDITAAGAKYSVASYGDWEFHDVTDGYIITDANGVLHMVNDMQNVQGWLDRDEPVVRTYQLGRNDTEQLTQRNDAEMGQNTIEVLVGALNVQITVTSDDEGPVYIRFLDSDMQPFGTDVDEEPMHRGADVVGLDSQGKLLLNRMVNLSAAQALAYDQYDVVTPGNLLSNSYLMGRDGDYHQGAFRFFNPCPQVDDHFYVEVYEKSGKYKRATEKVVCINPPRVVPSALSVTTFSDIPGRARLEWVEAIGATAHWVIVIEQSSGTVVPGSLQQIPSPDTAAEISGLRENVDYIFAVAAERRDASGAISYSAPSHIVQAMQWD